MPIQVLMPALSPTMEKGNLAKWLKKEGETIKSGDVIAEIETDKATMEVEATDEGTLGRILIPEGTADVAVNTPIATILADGESAADLGKMTAAPTAAPAPPAEAKAEAPQPKAEEKKAPSAPAAVAEPDPEVPAGTEMITQTIREALRDAMAEEMRRDADVFVMGEEVAEYQGAYKVTQGLLKAAIRDPNPVIFLENEMLYGHSGEVPKLDDYVIPIGKARVVRTGGHVTIVSWSNGMTYALKAADELAKEGIEAEVIDLRTLRPMDTDTIIASVKKTGRAVTVEEGWQQNGIGGEIAARIMEHAFDYLDAPVTRVSGKDVPMPYAANLEKLALPSTAEVVEAAKAVCYR